MKKIAMLFGVIIWTISTCLFTGTIYSATIELKDVNFLSITN